jgi:hypothetical protein
MFLLLVLKEYGTLMTDTVISYPYENYYWPCWYMVAFIVIYIYNFGQYVTWDYLVGDTY